jgi:signal transduction histidine kinase
LLPLDLTSQVSVRQLSCVTRFILVVLALLVSITAALIWQALLGPDQDHIDPATDSSKVTGLVSLLVVELILLVGVLVQRRQRSKILLLLRESSERFALAANSADVGLWLWEARDNRLWVSAQYRRIFDVPLGSSHTVRDMGRAVHPDDRAEITARVREAIAQGETWDLRYRLLAAGGTVRWVRARGSGERDGNRKLYRLAGAVVDITRIIEMESAIEAQRRSLMHLSRVGMLGELSGALAHELNQPLTAILSNAQAIQQMLDHHRIDLAEFKAAVADIIADDTRASDVIKHMRALLKKDDAKRIRLDLNAVLGSTLELARNALIAGRIQVVKRFGPKPTMVDGDVVQLEQMFLNLLLNAIEAMLPHGRGVLTISVDAPMEERVYRIAIADTGLGIHRQPRERLFEPFFSTKPQGLGLGLSITKAIAAAHGGIVSAESNSDGGATFRVTLPIRQEAANDHNCALRDTVA